MPEQSKSKSNTSKYRLLTDIKKSKMYGANPDHRDKDARNKLMTECNNINRGHIVPGQLILFNYFTPKTEEDLKYYDASPCTIFFGVFNSKDGKRILGFNIHYYPPKLRYNIMDRIFEIYKPVMTKYFDEGPDHEIDGFNYNYLVRSLNKAGLGFGVREYIPSLCGRAYIIPPKLWSTAVFTEGWFKKETREQIYKYWSAGNKVKRSLSNILKNNGKK